MSAKTGSEPASDGLRTSKPRPQREIKRLMRSQVQKKPRSNSADA